MLGNPIIRFLAAALLLAALSAAEVGAAVKESDLPERYRMWLESVELLITKEEKETFLELEKDYQRDAFIERFWRARDQYPDSARNEFKERWDARVEEAMYLFGALTDDRARVLLLNGPPDARLVVRCSDLWPGEVWYYARAENAKEEVLLLFVSPWGGATQRIWYPNDGFRQLLRFPAPGQVYLNDLVSSCPMDQADALVAAIRYALRGGVMGFDLMIHNLLEKPEMPSAEWVSGFDSFSTDVDESASFFSADLEVNFPGRRQNRTMVQGVLSVPRGEATMVELAGHGSYNFILTGEILREERLFDSFRYGFNLPASEIFSEKIPLVFERYLRPGEYSLILKVEDINGKKFYRLQRGLSVPAVEQEPRPPEDEETARLLAEANAAISSGTTTLQIVPPRGDLITGMTRIETMITGPDVDHVVFSLDDRPLLTKQRPPFSVELDLGDLPRIRTLAAIAYNDVGDELARDQIELNAGAHRFAARLVEPRRGKRYIRSLRAEAELQVPEGGIVERVEFYLNETLVATLYQEPWEQPMFLASDEELAYVRIVAYRPDGNSTEDTVFVNAPDYMENLNIEFVELYITALDKEKRPVLDLAEADFRVLEDGAGQRPVRFEQVTNLPIHALILLDVSASMEESLPMARDAALSFFEQAVTPKDRAALVTFNDHPNLTSKFSNSMAKLAGGLAGLKAERGTALYDSLVFALYYFNGIKGQRALVLLSDGQDEHSNFSWEDTLEYARRAGVAIYTIGLNLPRKLDVRRKLEQLAQETGGRRFLVEDASELPAIYENIQRELRSRYFLAYQSSNTSEDEDFRFIDVKISRPGVEAKTMRGYYP